MNCHKWSLQTHMGGEQQHSPPHPQLYVGILQKERKCWTWVQIIYEYLNSRNAHVLFLRIHLPVQSKLLHQTSKTVHKIPRPTCLTPTQIKYQLTDSLYFNKLFLFLNYTFNFGNHFNNFASPGNFRAVIHLFLFPFPFPHQELAVAKQFFSPDTQNFHLQERC